METANLTFKCTDRLKETKSIEQRVNAGEIKNESNEIKRFNRALITSLKEFQTQVNSLMSELVENERTAIEEKRLSNDHLKKKNEKAKNNDENEEDETSDNDDDNEGENNQQEENASCGLKRSKSTEHNESAAEKRFCVE